MTGPLGVVPNCQDRCPGCQMFEQACRSRLSSCFDCCCSGPYQSGQVVAQPLTMVSMTTGLTLGVLELNGQPLSLEQISQVASGSMDAAIAPAARPANCGVASRGGAHCHQQRNGLWHQHRLRQIVRCAHRQRETCSSCNATWCAATPAGWASRWKRPRCAPCCCCAPTSSPKD